MSSYYGICRRLPSLYRPENDDNDLLARFLSATAAILDEADREASMILQAHWFNYADDPRFDLYFNLYQALAYPEDPAQEGIVEKNKQKALLDFNYIHDLAHVSRLFQLSPWKDAINRKETVAHYRKRVSEIIGVYCSGLGTLSSLRQMIAAQLPDDSVDGSTRELAYILQEYVSAKRHLQAAQARGIPTETIGPLMRWTVNNEGPLPAIPTLYIGGLAASDHTNATEHPLVELFSDNEDKPCRIGIAYQGILAAGQTLRLTPVYHSWLASADGLLKANSDHEAPLPNPGVPGPWKVFPDTPAGEISKIIQVRDYTLWVVIGNTLQTFDGDNWQQRLTELPDVLCLIEYQDNLLIGTANGLLQLPLYPPDNIFTPQPAIADLDDIAVYDLCRLRSGTWWAATAEGIKVWDGHNFSHTLLGETEATRVPVYQIHQDDCGTITLATESGAIQYQPSFDHWYIFIGGESSDTSLDWLKFKAGDQFPAEETIFLPVVNNVIRSRDATLWFATSDGIACYRATTVRNFAYRTHLTAFPQLNTGKVSTIHEDQLGTLWFTCENGLFHYDGRHWQKLQNNELTRVPGSVESSRDTRPWRYHRQQRRWQVYDYDKQSWEPVIVVNQPDNESRINDILWTSSVHADLGTWDGQTFEEDNTTTPSPLRMRYKPLEGGEKRIVDGGIPSLPALSPGNSTWRYLKLEQDDIQPSPNRPHWTCEGRLIPPPEQLSDIEEGRFSSTLKPLSDFNDAVFAYKPSARVWFSWQAHQPLTLQVRLQTKENQIDPNIVDRVWEGIQQVRPAGSHVELVVNSNIIRGKSNG